jgi:hypothetical protein
MTAINYYFGAVTLLGGSMFLYNKSAPWSQLGCSQYDKVRVTRAVAIVLAVLALLCFAIAVIEQLSSATP